MNNQLKPVDYRKYFPLWYQSREIYRSQRTSNDWFLSDREGQGH